MIVEGEARQLKSSIQKSCSQMEITTVTRLSLTVHGQEDHVHLARGFDAEFFHDDVTKGAGRHGFACGLGRRKRVQGRHGKPALGQATDDFLAHCARGTHNPNLAVILHMYTCKRMVSARTHATNQRIYSS